MIVLGIDGGFASIGVAVVDLALDGELLRDVWVLRTEKSAKKLGVRSGDDTARRAREIAHHLDLAITSHQPVAIALEAPSWPRNAGVAAKMGVAFGVVFALAEKHRLPLVMASPQDVKKKLCSSASASKDEIIRAIEGRFPCVTWPSQKTLWEHAADAIAVVVACLDSDALQMARRLGAA